MAFKAPEGPVEEPKKWVMRLQPLIAFCSHQTLSQQDTNVISLVAVNLDLMYLLGE